MTKRNHKHPEKHEHRSSTEGNSVKGGLHKDWRLWVVVGLMLAAMFIYVLTLDDSVVPAIMRQ